MSDETQPETTEPSADIAGVPEPVEAPEEPQEAPAPVQAAVVDLSKIELSIGTSTAGPRDLLAQVNEYVEVSCRKFAMRDEISFLIGSTVVPINPEQVMPVISLTLAIPSLMIQQAMQGTVMIQDLFFTQEQIDGVVSDMLANLRNARIQQASNFGQPVN